MMTVSIVVPARNEEKTIGMVLEELMAAIEELISYKFEVIVVDDHSNDKTCEVAGKHGVAVIKNEARSGKGNALKAGFAKCKGDIIVMLDADGSHKPEDIEILLEAMRTGSGLVIGSRVLGGSDEFEPTRLFGNAALTLLFRYIFRVDIKDPLNGYKAFLKDVAHGCRSEGFEIEIELITNALRRGYTVVEVPSHERMRAGGEMKSRAWREGPKFLFAIILEGIKYRMGK